MERIKGTLKSLNFDLVFDNVELEFDYDLYNGIGDGIFIKPITNTAKQFRFSGQKFIFKNDEIVMYIYVYQTINDTVHFQTIRFKSILNESKTNGFIFFVTKSDLFHGQKLNLDGEKLNLNCYKDFCTIEFSVVKVDSEIMRKIRDIAENVLLFIQLLQTQHCKIIGYNYNKCLYIDYSQDNFKPFKYNKAPTFTKEHAELFIKKFVISPFRDYLAKIIYRLISAKDAPKIEMKCVWMIFALEAIESVYNMKETDNHYIRLNIIINKVLPNNDLIKVYFKNGKYWKPLLWIYRDKYVHFLRNANDLIKKPDNNQEEVLSYIFNDNFDVLTKEYKKFFPIAKRIVCEIIDLDYEKDFFKIA